MFPELVIGECWREARDEYSGILHGDVFLVMDKFCREIFLALLVTLPKAVRE